MWTRYVQGEVIETTLQGELIVLYFTSEESEQEGQ